MAPMTTGLKRLSSTVSTFSLRGERLERRLDRGDVAGDVALHVGIHVGKMRIGRDTLEPPHYPFHIDKLLFGAQLVEMFHLIAQDAEIPLELLLLCEGDQLPTAGPARPSPCWTTCASSCASSRRPADVLGEWPGEDHVPADREASAPTSSADSAARASVCTRPG